MRLETAPFAKYRAHEHPVEAFDETVTLGRKVEHHVTLVSGGRDVALELRLLMGRQWLRLIHGIGAYDQDFIDTYTIEAPDPNNRDDAEPRSVADGNGSPLRRADGCGAGRRSTCI